MKFFKKITLFTIIFFVFQANLLADVPYYLDFKYILNQSEAGKKAQINLKNKLDSGIKKLKAKVSESSSLKKTSQYVLA